MLQDDAPVLEFFAGAADMDTAEYVAAFIGNENFFGPELGKVAGLKDYVAGAFDEIQAKGMKTVLAERFGG